MRNGKLILYRLLIDDERRRKYSEVRPVRHNSTHLVSLKMKCKGFTLDTEIKETNSNEFRDCFETMKIELRYMKRVVERRLKNQTTTNP